MCCKNISPFCGMSHHAAGYFLSHAKAFELCDLACLFWEFFPVTSFPETTSLCLCCSFSLSPNSFQVSGLNMKALSPFWVDFCVKRADTTPWSPHFRGNAAGGFSAFSVMTPGLSRSPYYVVAHSSCFPVSSRLLSLGWGHVTGGLLCISWIVMRFLSLGMLVCAVLFVDLRMLNHPCIPGGKSAWSWCMIFCTGSWIWTTDYFFYW